MMRREGQVAGDGPVARECPRSGDCVEGVREEILASWRRCRMRGADPARWDPPYRPEFDDQSPLLLAATPVLDRLASQVRGEDVALLLADEMGRIVTRRVGENALLHTLDDVAAAEGFVYSEDATGTNGLGTVVETGSLIEVVGREHFAEQLGELTCVGVPVTHPLTGRLAGVIDITCYARQTNALMRPLMEQAARDIAERLYLQHDASERSLLQHFQRAARRTTCGVVAVNDRCVLSNATAYRMLAGTDQSGLWEAAGGAMTANASTELELEASGGDALRVHVVPLRDGNTSIGSLVEIRPAGSAGLETAPGDTGSRLPGLVGHSAAWRRCCAETRRALAMTDRLLLSGEPGVGKHALAASVHRTRRPDTPLIVADAAGHDTASRWLGTIRDRLSAHPSGTLILRHVHLLAPSVLQALRPTLHDLRQAGGLCIATETSTVPGELPDHGDVWDVRVEVPPLRERLADLPALVTALRSGLVGRDREISTEVMQLFHRLTWPGNVAQLAAVLHGFSVEHRAGPVRIAEVPDGLVCSAARRPLGRLERAEVHTILSALREAAGNKKQAAAVLGISRSTLYRKLNNVGIHLEHSVF